MENSTMNKIALGLIAGSALILAGCGSDPGGRALSGGLLGAGAGAAIGAATGGNPATGALIGGAVGAVGGAATSPCDVDLNAPDGRRDCR
jgi:osmotically inducible lipoprotein OsmB